MAESEDSKIKLQRNKLGYSQNDLAEKSGVSKRVIQNYEQGARVPVLSNLLKMSKALKCRVSDIIDDEKLAEEMREYESRLRKEKI